MSVKTQITKMVDLIPEAELSVVLDVVRHFVPVTDADDIATADDFAAHNEAMLEYSAGEAVEHDSINWD